MRVIHISEHGFLTLPDRHSLMVQKETGCIRVGSSFNQGFEVTGHSDENEYRARLKAHTDSEYARFVDWLTGWDEHGEFRFQAVLDVSAPVADTPARLRGEFPKETEIFPLPVDAEIAASAVIVGESMQT